jgi:glycosyltransferase involved in cell wall biosynthesis
MADHYSGNGLRLCFLTSTPLNVAFGSGTFAGISGLARGLREIGTNVSVVNSAGTDTRTRSRLRFNRALLQNQLFGRFEATIGFDLDGFLLPGQSGIPHIACPKGVLADETVFENGPAQRKLGAQSRYEKYNVQRAHHVIATSIYSAQRIREFYGPIPGGITIVPELIPLSYWQHLFRAVPPRPEDGAFRVLCVCRFYRRKRVDQLIHAIAALDPGSDVRLRLIGNGPESARLQRLAADLGLEKRVTFLGDISTEALAKEYVHCDAFALMSAQEGFGIVLLEAMAAGKPILAARAAALPEVAPHALFIDPVTPFGIAEAILRLRDDPVLCRKMAEEGLARVTQFDAPTVARQFLSAVSTGVLPRLAASSIAGGSTSTAPAVAG